MTTMYSVLSKVLVFSQSLIVDDMQILLLFSSLSVRRCWQIIERRASIVLQIVEGQVLQFRWFHTQIFECFRCLVDLLIDEFPFNLVGRVENLPPQELIEIMSQRFEHLFWNVDMSSLLDDFSINDCRYLSHGVFRRSVELKCLPRCGVVKSNLLESLSHINSLSQS